MQASDVLTLEMVITAEFQEKLQQLNIGGGKERQTRIECSVKVLGGSLSQLQLVRDSPNNTQKLIELDETPAGECRDNTHTATLQRITRQLKPRSASPHPTSARLTAVVLPCCPAVSYDCFQRVRCVWIV